MSDFDVYEGDMPRRTLTQADIELLLGPQVPVRDDLARFSAVLGRLHVTGPTDLADGIIAEFSEMAADIARSGREASLGATEISVPRRERLLLSRLAGALGAAVFLTGMTGVAMADDAVPGDVLYGLDRAMESIGVGDSGPSERIAEAQELFRRGQTIAAIAHAAVAVEAARGLEESQPPGSLLESSMAIDALRRAADRVEVDTVNGDDPAVKNAVAGILTEIATMLESEEMQFSEFGARISEMAREIGRRPTDSTGTAETPEPTRGDRGSAEQPNPPTGPPEDGPSSRPDGSPGGPPDDVPGQGRP